jgi:hypothetical protein
VTCPGEESGVVGVWAVLTVITIFFGLPAILGTFLGATHGSARLIGGWVDFMVASLAVEFLLTAAVMVLL